MCDSVHLYECQPCICMCQRSPEEHLRSLRDRAMSSCEAIWRECWELKWGSLEEQQELLKAEPSLQPHTWRFMWVLENWAQVLMSCSQLSHLPRPVDGISTSLSWKRLISPYIRIGQSLETALLSQCCVSTGTAQMVHFSSSFHAEEIPRCHFGYTRNFS